MMEQDVAFKQKYQKHKMRVKIWEKEFKKTKGRIPSKYDIHEAPREIRDSYRMYYKLKTSFLEDTLNDVLSEDGFDVFEMSANDGCLPHDEDISADVDGAPSLPHDISALLEGGDRCGDKTERNFSNLPELSKTPHVLTNVMNMHEDHVIKQFEAVENFELNAKAWGDQVSRKASLPAAREDKAAAPKKTFKSNLKHELFRSSSFSMRNPRKSLSRSRSQLSAHNDATHGGLGMDEEPLPDLETILTQKAREQQATAAISANPLLSMAVEGRAKLAVNMGLDEGWLNRTAAQNSLEMQPILKETAKSAASMKTYGLSNINMFNLPPPKPEDQLEVTMPVVEAPSPPSKAPPLGQTNSNNNNNDSDSVVSDSEGEERNDRHIAKKRRLQAVSPEQVAATRKKRHEAEAEAEAVNKVAQEPLTATVSPKDPAKIAEEANKSYEYPSDEDSESEKPKTKRKRAVARRTKQPAKKAAGNTKTKSPAAKTTRERKKAAPKKSPTTKAGKAATTTRKTRSKATDKPAEPDAAGEPAVEEEPPNPEVLRYNLALENIELTSAPRLKLTDLEKANHVVERYVNTFTGSHSTTANGIKRGDQGAVAVNEKRAKERRKLEEKIATGKLNENYVTIDIQKKKFSRGKKSVNFSKYKKTQWRQKKREAALCGPDMDMRGCDGGVMTCFTCGQPGHFAQQCKLKGDTLLPLTAQLVEDPSPFPTLEEAECMAAQKAVVMHSRNLSKLPAAGNSALYREQSQSDADDKEDNRGDTEEGVQEHQAAVEGKQDADLVEESDNEDARLKGQETETEESDSDYLETDEELDEMDIDAAVSEALVVEEEQQRQRLIDTKIPTALLEQAGLAATDSAGGDGGGAGSSSSKINPTKSTAAFSKGGGMYTLNEDGTVPAVTDEVMEALRLFGHSDFRKGQDRAVMRILCGLSTLVTLSTGSGKSLCYQLPAYLFSRQKGAITLVISPLVSLMEDQVTGVPHFLRALCLHTNQTPQQRAKTLQLINAGEVDVLLVSPEAVVAGERSTGFGSILRQLPPIAFACIDEAHCVSQWSHNFRPSYLMICKVLRKNLGVHTVLGLTATATLPTRRSIIEHLGIVDGERGVITDTPLPDNLILSVSKDENRDNALLCLMNSKRFEGCHSIIIYCTRRDECERVAGFLRTMLQDRPTAENPTAANDGKSTKRKRTNWHAEPYHAGMPASRRRTIQNAFMRNELRIVVATIAFGMGINKPDIRAVIHYNMPRNFESYVQEIGRSGRDGLLSHCHLFLDARGGDQFELRRHIYANSLDRHVIRKLLQCIFVPCSCEKNMKGSMATSYIMGTEEVPKGGRQHICPGHEIAFSIEQTVQALDIPEQNISTLLCYMELDTRWQINVLSSAYIKAKVISYGGAKYLKHAAKECPPLAMAIALQIKKGTFDEASNVFEFSVVDIAAAIGWNSGVVKYQLKNLEWVNVKGRPQRSPITVTFSDLGLRLKVPGDFTAEEIDDALDTLYNRAVTQEQTQLMQLQYVFQGLSSVSYNSYVHCSTENFSHDRSDQLKGIVRNYFRNDYPKDIKLEIEPSPVPDDSIANDVHALINMYPENNFSGRNVARIFHGINSPNYPAVMWWRCKFWRVHAKVDFNHIVRLANGIIVRRRT